MPLITARRVLMSGAAVLVATTAVFVRPHTSYAQASSVAPNRCDSDTGAATEVREYVSALVSAQGPSADRTRAVLHLPSASSSDVTVVTDSSVCERVYAAHVSASYGGDTTAVRWISVVQVAGTRYVVWDLTRRAGEFTILDIYDANGPTYLVSVTR